MYFTFKMHNQEPCTGNQNLPLIELLIEDVVRIHYQNICPFTDNSNRLNRPKMTEKRKRITVLQHIKTHCVIQWILWVNSNIWKAIITWTNDRNIRIIQWTHKWFTLNQLKSSKKWNFFLPLHTNFILFISS